MQQQERDLISGLFERLKPFESQARDGEADSFIRGLTAQQPAASYLLVRTVLVQEQALKAAQERIAELGSKTADAPAAGAGFLGSAPKIEAVGRAGRRRRAPHIGARHRSCQPFAVAGRRGAATAAERQVRRVAAASCGLR